MNLTREYVLWKLGYIDRREIVGIVDSAIQRLPNPTDDLIELSISSSVDDYEFEKRLMPLIVVEQLNQGVILSSVINVVRTATADNIANIFNGLRWIFYDLEYYKSNNLISILYHNLDHLINDAIPGGYAKKSDLESFIGDWLRNNAV
jgi:hypothetical protein